MHPMTRRALLFGAVSAVPAVSLVDWNAVEALSGSFRRPMDFRRRRTRG